MEQPDVVTIRSRFGDRQTKAASDLYIAELVPLFARMPDRPQIILRRTPEAHDFRLVEWMTP